MPIIVQSFSLELDDSFDSLSTSVFVFSANDSILIFSCNILEECVAFLYEQPEN